MKIRVSSAVLFVLVVSANAALAAANRWTIASPNSNLSITIVQKVLSDPYQPQNNLYYRVSKAIGYPPLLRGRRWAGLTISKLVAFIPRLNWWK